MYNREIYVLTNSIKKANKNPNPFVDLLSQLCSTNLFVQDFGAYPHVKHNITFISN